MKKFLIAISTLLIFSTGNVWAQTSLSFYNMGAATFQNGSFNPAFVPQGRLFIGLPVLSGIHLNYNNRLSYKEVVARQENGDSKIDLRKGLKNLGVNNMMSVHTNISLFHVGVRVQNGTTFSVFANERIETDILYDRKVMNFLVKGNTTVIDQKIEIGKTRIAATHFREIGLGISYPSPNADVILGARLKYLQGFTNMSTPENQSAYISSNGDTYIINGNTSNAMLRSSGLDILQGNEGNLGTHLISNSNGGFAVDLGFHWTMDKYNQISVSINDLGYISWKENIKNRFIADTTFTYSGIDLKHVGNIEETVQDSLIDRFSIEKNEQAYTTLVGPRAYASWSYKVNDYGGEIVTSGGARYVQNKMKFLLGVGYRQSLGNYFVGTVNVTKLPQQFFNLGASIAAKGGPAQFYLAVDQVYNFDVTKFQSLDVRVGINFIFGSRGVSQEQVRRGATTTISNEKVKKKGPGFSQNQSFMGSRVKVIRQEEIYNIIPRQERRKQEEYMSEPPE